MSALNWSAFIIALITIFGAIAGAIRWLVKYYLHELRPDNNGGHNLLGRIERIEKQVDAIHTIVMQQQLGR